MVGASNRSAGKRYDLYRHSLAASITKRRNRNEMKQIFYFLFIGFSLNSCFQNKEIKNQAISISKEIDSLGLTRYKQWTDYKSGEGVRVWYKKDFKYSCQLKTFGDSTIMTIVNYCDFAKDMCVDKSCSFEIIPLRLIKHLDYINIVGMDNVGNWKKIQTIQSENYNNFFSEENLFEYFDEFGANLDRLGILSYSKNDHFGGYIQFYLSNNYILTYLPDNIENDTSYINSGWNKEIEKGQIINKHWTIRKQNK